jgi:AcrR family transcriptional regulator
MADSGRDQAEPTDLRDAHQAETRRRIVQAVNDLLAEEHPSSISVPAVVARSGISRATIYRHFPTKEALLDASATSVDEQTRAWLGTAAPIPGQNLGEFIHRVWAELAEHLPALRASQLPGLGRELRQRRSARRHADAVRAMQGAGIDVDTDEGSRAVRLTLALSSSSMLLEQLDRLGIDVETAADDVVWAIETIARVVREQQASEPTAD